MCENYNVFWSQTKKNEENTNSQNTISKSSKIFHYFIPKCFSPVYLQYPPLLHTLICCHLLALGMLVYLNWKNYMN